MNVSSEKMMKEIGKNIGLSLRGGEVIELIGDVGVGKTTFMKGLGAGLGVAEDISSPSFTISRVYGTPDQRTLHHYDFYRLPDPGIMVHEIDEITRDNKAVVCIEWADSIRRVLPDSTIRISFAYGETADQRNISIETSGAQRYVQDAIEGSSR